VICVSFVALVAWLCFLHAKYDFRMNAKDDVMMHANVCRR
jgi:hypothetical protein